MFDRLRWIWLVALVLVTLAAMVVVFTDPAWRACAAAHPVMMKWHCQGAAWRALTRGAGD